MSQRKLLNWTAILSILALVAHAVDAPDHLTEWWGYGTFFVIVAAFQFFYGLVLFVRPWQYDEEGNCRPDAEQRGKPYFILGTILTALVVVVYAVVHTVGMPFLGPNAGAESITPLSLIPPLECLPLLWCHVLLLSRSRHAQTTSPSV